MSKTLLAVLMILTVPVVSFAAERVSIALPNHVLAVLASPDYKKAFEEAKASPTIKHLNKDDVMIIGYDFIKGERFGGTVKITLGTTDAPMWPGSVYKIGTITAEAEFFPDGINGYESRGAKLEMLEKPENYDQN